MRTMLSLTHGMYYNALLLHQKHILLRFNWYYDMNK